jgi:hypothetical protein
LRTCWWWRGARVSWFIFLILFLRLWHDACNISVVGIDVLQRVCETHFLSIPRHLHLCVLTSYWFYSSLFSYLPQILEKSDSFLIDTNMTTFH